MSEAPNRAKGSDMLALAMRQPFGLMLNGRPGPMHIDVLLNVFVEPMDARFESGEDSRRDVSVRPESHLR
jgi:hypothetical protein